ncbi:transposase [Halococcus salifodinae]|nr:transposase [Halococcus salifodinae]
MSESSEAPPNLAARAVEMLIERVEEQFDDGVDNLSRAITNATVPLTIGDDPYDENRGKYGFEQMIKVYIYRRVRGFSQETVADRIQRQPYLQIRFEFADDVPRQQTLSETESERFTPETKRVLDIAAEAIAREADDCNAIVEELAPSLLKSDDDSDEEPSKRERKRQATHQTVRFARQTAIPHFETSRADNKEYLDEEIFDVLARMCATTGSANSEGEIGWLTDDDYTPDGKTILRTIKKFGTPEEEARQAGLDDYLTDAEELPDIAAIRDAAVTAFDLSTRNTISAINGDTPFADRETIAAIDMTYERIYVPPWEDREEEIPNEAFPKMASGYLKGDNDQADEDDGSGPKEARYGFKYATITLVGDNVPIILGVEPVKEASGWESEDAVSYDLSHLVDRLLTKAQEFVDIDTVLFDREFYGHAVFNTVDEHNVTYITPKKEYKQDIPYLDNLESDPEANVAVEHGVESSDGDRTHELSIIYVPSRNEDGKYAMFATNQRVETDEVDSVVNKYRRRWDIEIEYKAIKDFMPRTSSMDYRVRFVNFVFATLIYNLWRLTDYLLKRKLDRPIRDDPEIGSRTFARFIGTFLRTVG